MTEVDWAQRWRDAQREIPLRDRSRNGGPFAELDALGRKQPRRLGVADYLLLIARIEPARVRRVPATAIPEEGQDDEGSFALVSCPCGHRPVARERLEQCAGCERWYTLVATRSAVFVAYGDMELPPLAVHGAS